MELAKYFKAVVDADNGQVVICDTDHMILYMNEAAKKQYRRDLTGRNLMDCHNEKTQGILKKVLAWFQATPDHNRVHAYLDPRSNADVYIVALRDDAGEVIGYYEKPEVRTLDESPFYRMD